MKKQNKLKLFAKYIIYSLLTSFIIEITIINYRHYESLLYKEKANIKYKIYNSSIKISNINSKVNNIFIDFDTQNKKELVALTIKYSDEGNKNEFEAGKRVYAKSIDKSHYIKINPSGKVKSITILLENLNQNTKLKDIRINKKVPFSISIKRILYLSLIISFILFVRTKSPFHKIQFDSKYTKYIMFYISLIAIVSSLYSSSLNYIVNSSMDRRSNQYQYNHLAEALHDGQLSLKLKVSKELKSLENPYDTQERLKKLGSQGKYYYWDYSYYNGKYYSYFGILPCILFYLPYYSLTNKHIPNYIVLSITSFLLFLSISFFIYQLCKKYFKKTTFPQYILLSFFLYFSSGIIYALSEPGFYCIPILLGLVLSFLGLGLIIKSTIAKKRNYLHLSLGYLSLALISCCRPQLLISLFLSIPLIYKYVISNKNNRAKKILCIIIPVIIIAALAMTYNYKRFGSIFDFGANYNITTNDMTHRGIKLDRTFLGYFTYLFQPLNITPIFPFINDIELITDYLGFTVYEEMYGGSFFINIIFFLSIYPHFYKKIKNKELLHLCILSLISTITIIFFDTQMSGILPRYYLDYSWLLCINTIIILLTLSKKTETKKIMTILILLSILTNIITFFTNGTLYFLNEYFYYNLYYHITFWL